MGQATFPPLEKKADKLNGRDGITVPLDETADTPPTALRVRASNALGRNVVVAWMLSTLSKKWEAWLFAFLGAAITLFRKQIKAAFDSWGRQKHRPRPGAPAAGRFPPPRVRPARSRSRFTTRGSAGRRRSSTRTATSRERRSC